MSMLPTPTAVTTCSVCSDFFFLAAGATVALGCVVTVGLTVGLGVALVRTGLGLFLGEWSVASL